MWVTRRALLLHLVVLTVVPTFLGLAWWQLNRALSGNSLSWAYTFEWPFFAAYAVFVWWKMVHQQPDGPEARARAAAQHAERPVGWALQAPPRRRDHRSTAVAGATGSGGTAEAAAGVVAGAEAFLGVPPAGDAGGQCPGAGDPAAGSAPAADGTRNSDDDEDAALAEYNRYLAALNASGRRKTW